MGGAGCGYLEAFIKFAKLPIRVENIRGIPDPMFYGVNPEPIPQNIQLTMQRLESEPASSLAVLTDGDADRVGAVLPGGFFFSSHQIFCVLLDHLHQKGLGGRVVKTFSTTQLIEPLAQKRGLEVLETPIGFKYITDAMLEGNVLIGGEESGGLGVIGHIPERDGLLNSLLLLEAVAKQNKGLAEIFANLEAEVGIQHHYDRVDLHLENTISRNELENKLADYTEFAGYKILKRSNKDGIKLQLENHVWVLFRPSGTEPVLRLYCEAPEKELVTQILETAVRIFTNNSGTQG
jgi:phosphomannomutase